MRKRSFWAIPASSTLIPLVLLACSSKSNGEPSSDMDAGVGTSNMDSGSGPSTKDASTDSATGTMNGNDGGSAGDAGGAPGTMANVRVAHLSPGAPAVDFCIAPHGMGTFTGPVLSKLLGVSAGLSYGSVTSYVPVPAGQYDVRIVAPGGTSCATSLASLPDFTNLPALAAGGDFTIGAEGVVGASGATAFGLYPYADDTSVPSGKAALRFIHASPGTPAVDVGVGAGAGFTPVFQDVAYNAVAAAGGGIDSNGYLVTSPLAAVELSARAHGTTADALIIPSATLPSGTIATAFAIGALGSGATPLEVLLCADNAMTMGALTKCSPVGYSQAQVRVAHVAPGAPAVDVCLEEGDAGFVGPLFASLDAGAGLSYEQVTGYVPVAPGTYTIRVVAAPAANCNSPAVPDTHSVNVPLTYATVAATGALGFDAGEPFALKVLVDDPVVAAGSAAVRFVHASPGTPAVNVGLESGPDGGTAGFTTVFSNVAFGQVAAATDAGIDPNGYYVGAPLSNVYLGAEVAPSGPVALETPEVSVGGNQIFTAFAVGTLSNPTYPLRVLLCQDNGAEAVVNTTCAVVQ